MCETDKCAMYNDLKKYTNKIEYMKKVIKRADTTVCRQINMLNKKACDRTRVVTCLNDVTRDLYGLL